MALNNGDCHKDQHEEEDSTRTDQVGDEAKESHGRLTSGSGVIDSAGEAGKLFSLRPRPPIFFATVCAYDARQWDGLWDRCGGKLGHFGPLSPVGASETSRIYKGFRHPRRFFR